MRLALLFLAIPLAACGDKTITCSETLDTFCGMYPAKCQGMTYQDFIDLNCPAPAATGVFTGTCHGYKIVRLESSGIEIAMFDEDTNALVAITNLSVVDEDYACAGGPDTIADPDCDLKDLTLTCGQNPDL